jgi:hypothetical protein
MSRSYKKPFKKDHNKGVKNFANRSIRRMPIDKEIGNGTEYRKHYAQYDICDWHFQWNPYPRVRCNYRTGELEWVEPDPVWKWNRK